MSQLNASKKAEMTQNLVEKDKNISRSVTDLNSLNSEQLKIR